MMYEHSAALDLLGLAIDTSTPAFRPGQEHALRHIIQETTPLLVVQPPGWGKSLIALIATKLLRQAGMGPTLFLSPHTAHIHQAVRTARRLGLVTAGLTADESQDRPDIESSFLANEIDVLFISTDRFANPQVHERILRSNQTSIGLLVCEHVHALCEGSHDFRPQYKGIERLMHRFPKSMRWLLSSSALTPSQLGEVQAIFQDRLNVLKHPVHRPSLTLQTLQLKSQADRFAWLAENVPTLSGQGILFTGTKRDAHQVADWLRSKGVVAHPNTSHEGAARATLEQAFLEDRVKVLVTTPTLGVAVHKPDVKFVIHYDPPTSLHDYYQQLDQVGSTNQPAYGVMMSGPTSDEHDTSPLPTLREVQQVYLALRKAQGGISPQRLAIAVNAPLARIRYALQLFTLENDLVRRIRSRWHLVPNATLPESLIRRIERLHKARSEAKEQLGHYFELQDGHLEYLMSAIGLESTPGDLAPRELHSDSEGLAPTDSPAPLDTRAPSPSNAPPPLPSTVAPEMVTQAQEFLRSGSIILEPRKQWPPGGMPRYRLWGRMPRELWAHPGKALCISGDSGWGKLVAEGKRTGRFSDELVQACVKLYRRWRPVPQPMWVTCIPSRRHPHLVPDFAARLARQLNLPFRPVFEQSIDRPPQETMANSTRHALNVDGTLRLTERPIPGPVLLVDDMVNSRWTFTIAAWLLRKNGVPAVFPLALAARYGLHQAQAHAADRRSPSATG